MKRSRERKLGHAWGWESGFSGKAHCKKCKCRRKIDMTGGPRGGAVTLYSLDGMDPRVWSKEMPACQEEGE